MTLHDMIIENLLEENAKLNDRVNALQETVNDLLKVVKILEDRLSEQ
jgi:hypothetical protein